MKHLEVTSDTGSVNACGSCCCETVSGIPGTTDLWRVNYAPWVLPMGGKGLSTHFSATVKLLHKSDPLDTQIQVQNVVTKSFESVTIDLSTFVTDYEPDMEFEIIPGYEPKNGSWELVGKDLTLKSASGVVGFDALMFRVIGTGRKSGVGEVFVEWVRLNTEVIAPAVTERTTPVVNVPRSRVKVNNAMAFIDVAVNILPSANIGDIYRITFRANALDCDAECYPKETCYDLTIGKC